MVELGFWVLEEMEPDEISVVLQRASELHAKISDAIERALKSEFLLTTTGAKSGGSAAGSPGSDAAVGSGSPEDDGKKISDEYKVPGDGNAEARSLGDIRDALETLEEQLECLQTLQHQQRVERDTALADLEESRRILLNRLKNHHGKEWEVVHEALAFAGEPVDDRDELPLPPYPMPLPDPRSFAQDVDGQSPPFRAPLTLFNSGVSPGSEVSQAEPNSTDQAQKQKGEGNFFGLPFNFNLGKFAGRLFGPGIGVTSKAAMVVASVITIIFFAEIGSRRDRKKRASRSRKLSPKRPAAPASCPKASMFEEKCPAGKVMIMQDGVPKCVVKERIEIPFHKEVKAPDVLYGRG